MRSLRRLFNRVLNSLTGQVHDKRLKEEIEEHIALQTSEYVRAGLVPVEARRQAMIKFGGIEAIQETYRAEGGLPSIENFLQDVRFSLRLLRKSPGFTVTVVLTLAMAIGANAIGFGMLDALILHPLNLPEEESLYAIQHGSDHNPSQSYPDYIDLRDRSHSFDDLAAYSIDQAGLGFGQEYVPRLGLRSERELFRRFRRSAVSWPFFPPLRMSMVPTAPPISCSHMYIGTATFRMILVLLVVLFS